MGFATCNHFHDNHCLIPQIVKFLNIFKNTYKMYFFVHLIPLILYKRKDMKNKPLKTIVKFVLGWLRSMFFVCSFALLSRYAWCSGTGNGNVNYSKFGGWMILAGFGILLESRSRMPEYPMNLLPRYFESLPIFLGKMGLFPKVPYGINILAAIAFSVLSSCYFTDHKSVKAHLRWLLSCVIGESGDTQIEEVPIPAIKQSGKDGL